MIIGVPKEIKNNESRVGMTPAGVFELVKNGHTVYVQSHAGEGSGFFDKDYKKVGAAILETIQEVYAAADMVVKVKEPIQEEYGLVKEDQIVFTYFHFASSEPLTRAMIDSKSVCIAYETVEDEEGTLPLLTPMSEVAGRMAPPPPPYSKAPNIWKNRSRAAGCCWAAFPGLPQERSWYSGPGSLGYRPRKWPRDLGPM